MQDGSDMLAALQALNAEIGGDGALLLAELELSGQPRPWDHRPPGDAYDPVSHAQWYFHRHDRPAVDDAEIGHFHCFLRGWGMPEGTLPAGIDADEAVTHLAAIAVDARCRPLKLFATNRWVTDETWLPAPVVASLLPRFTLGNASPAYRLNRWLEALLALHRPAIAAMLQRRDAALQAAGGLAALDDAAVDVLAVHDL